MLPVVKPVAVKGIGIHFLRAENDRRDAATKSSVMMIGDAGGPHVRTRAAAVVAAGHPVRLVTPRLSDVAAYTEISSADWGVADFMDAFPTVPADIVHIHYASSVGAWSFAASSDMRPLMVTVMGGDVLFDEQSQPSCFARWLVKQVLRRADRLTAKSDYLATALIDMGVAPDKIETVMWGVDTDHFKPVSGTEVRQGLGISERAKVIFSPRMLHRFYRIEMIIRALASLNDGATDVHLLIAEYDADPSYRAECVELATALGVASRVHFIGYVTPTQMPSYYGAADVVVSIPPSDGFPQTVLEAMACGKPNILVKLPCFEGLLEDGENALFVDPSAAALSAGIEAVFQDAALAARLLDGGHAFIGRYGDSPINVANVSCIYQDLDQQGVSRPLPVFVRMAIRGVLIGKDIRDHLRSMLGAHRAEDWNRSA